MKSLRSQSLKKDNGWVVLFVFGQIHIKNLIVLSKERGKGIGKLLVNRVEEIALERNCNFLYVESFSYQAPEFYLKCGFHLDFVRHGFNQDISYYYLSKMVKDSVQSEE
jgi:GNAT superfamily N-acetyltransferase